MNEALYNRKRLEEISRLKLHHEGLDELLQSHVKKAAEEFDLPIAAVSIVLDSTQYFIGQHGMDDWVGEVSGTPAEWSFCQNSVVSKKPFIVENALENKTMKDSPLVQEEGLRCYAGAPMISKNGEVLGNFCVKGKEVREFTEQEIERLKSYAVEIVEILEDRAQ